MIYLSYRNCGTYWECMFLFLTLLSSCKVSWGCSHCQLQPSRSSGRGRWWPGALVETTGPVATGLGDVSIGSPWRMHLVALERKGFGFSIFAAWAQAVSTAQAAGEPCWCWKSGGGQCLWGLAHRLCAFECPRAVQAICWATWLLVCYAASFDVSSNSITLHVFGIASRCDC